MNLLRWIGLAATIAAPAIASAQTRVEIGPLLGYFRPFGNFEPSSVYSTTLPRDPKDLKGRSLGGESRVWFGDRVGAELRGSVARSTIPSVSTPVGPSRPTSADVTTLTTQALLTVLGRPARYQVWISGGVGLVHHGGEAYEQHTSLTDVGPVVGAGARIRLNRNLHATGGFSAVTYMFDMPMPSDLQLNPGSLERGRQLDVLVHIGVSWMFVRN
jgi:hypothetical protein